MTLDLSITKGKRTRISVFNQGTLLRQIGARDLYSIGYGDVGSSIFYALGVTTIFALGATPLAIMIAGVFFVCICLTYAELGAAIPEPGGSSTFARLAFNDFLSFISGWALLLDYVVTIAISAYTVVSYGTDIHPSLALFDRAEWHIPIAIGIIALLFFLNVIGIKESGRVSFLLCSFSIIIQGLVIVVGLFTVLNLPYVFHFFQVGVSNLVSTDGVVWAPDWPNFLKGIAMAMVAYIGIESISQLAGETKNPGKAVPRAIIGVMFTLLIVYAGITLIAFSGAIPAREMGMGSDFTEKPLAVIASVLPIGGEIITTLVAILGVLILIVAANAGLVGSSRLTFTMGEHYQLPNILYRLHPKFKTPYIALFVFSLLAAVIVTIGKNLHNLAELYNFGAMLSFMLAHASIIGLRIRQPDLERPFLARPNIRLGGFLIPLTAVLGFLGCFAVWLDVIYSKPAGRYLGFCWIGFGLIAFLTYRSKQQIAVSKTVELDKIEVEGYQRHKAKKILVATRGSKSMEALQAACKTAKEDGASLVVLYVVEVPSHLPVDTFLPQQFIDGEKTLQRAEAIAGDYGIPIEKKILQGRIAGEAICEIAAQENCDLIVIGGPTQRPLGERLHGRSMDYVLQHAKCRVMVYRE